MQTQRKLKTTPTRQQLIDAVEHISFEMNRYLYTACPIFPLPGRYGEAVAESCLLHSRTIGEFFFAEETRIDDNRILHYHNVLISKDELDSEIEKSKSKWTAYKEKVNKQLGHLTFKRLENNQMHMQEKDELKFDRLIQLFENNLPEEFREKWEYGKSFSI